MSSWQQQQQQQRSRRHSASYARSGSIPRKHPLPPPIDHNSTLLRGTVASTNYHLRQPSGTEERRSFPECLRSGSVPQALHNRRHSLLTMQSNIPLEPAQMKPLSNARCSRPLIPKIQTTDLHSYTSDESEEAPPKQRRAESAYFERLDSRMDEIMLQIQKVANKIDRLESELQTVSQGLSPDFEKRILLSLSTAVEDHIDNQVLANRMVNAIVPELEAWWMSKMPRTMLPMRVTGGSPAGLLPSCSPGAHKRIVMQNRSAGIGRTPGQQSMLTDSLSFSENGTEWGGASQVFCTPSTTMPIQRAQANQELWTKSIGDLKDTKPLNPAASAMPPLLNPIKEDKSPSVPTLSRESTAHATPSAEKRIPTLLAGEEDTPKPSSKGPVSPCIS